MVNFESETDFDVDFDAVTVSELVVAHILKEEGCDMDCEVEILLTDAETVHEINREYRKIDSTTDVLSFPNVEWEEPSDFSGPGFSDELLINPDTGNVMLGQIVLCKERIFSQAEEFGHSVKREFAFLIAHSMLHLLGYDHMSDEEASDMFQKQDRYLNDINIRRE